ncbi:MAG: extracellular solute-binding protein [Patescibacteria group bacterium]|jgi:ABC-type glycerol-3-phosphate transport system substrate-binding protein
MDFKKKMIIMGAILVLSIGGIIAYQALTSKKTGPTGDCDIKALPKSAKLTWWGDLPETIAQNLINAYTASRPYITIAYTKLDPKTSEQTLIEAWARDTGPDIYSVKSEALKHFSSGGLISPMPAKTVYYTVTKKKTLGIKEETTICKTEKAAPTPETLKSVFVSGAYNDMYQSGKILGFPLQFDSVAMFYNQQLLDEAGILTPPKTWSEFVNIVPKLTLVDDQGKIIRAGAALGSGINVPRNPEIVTAILKQYKISLADQTSNTTSFQNAKDINLVLNLASSFGNPTKTTYTWNETFPSAMDALAQGKVAIAFGTAADFTELKNQTTGADIRVAGFPQDISTNTVYIADYWLQTVAPRAKDANAAWDFLRFAADTNQAQTVSKTAGTTPAIRSLVESASNIAEGETASQVQVFAKQAATAMTWFPGLNPEKGREALNNLIDDLTGQKVTASEAIDRASKVFQLSLTTP